jgi:hypothetical protein
MEYVYISQTLEQKQATEVWGKHESEPLLEGNEW